MLMPLAGEEVEDELKGVAIQGLMPKPLVLDDVWAIVGQAMACGIETTPMSAAVWPEGHVVTPLAEELACKKTSADSSGWAG